MPLFLGAPGRKCEVADAEKDAFCADFGAFGSMAALYAGKAAETTASIGLRPVASLFRFREEGEAIEIANATLYGLSYGLASYFFTSDLRRSWRVAERLEFGMVGLSTGMISMEVAPFGGVKESGIVREGSKYGIEEYLEVKALHIRGLN
jgi:Aldehyde dehydrogenase family